jgi:hypothetical protein
MKLFSSLELISSAVSSSTRSNVNSKLRRATVEPLEPRQLFAAPKVIGAEFLFEHKPHKIVYHFDSDVSFALEEAALRVRNLLTDTVVDQSGQVLDWDGSTNTATFTFPWLSNNAVSWVFPDGNYVATLTAGFVQNAAGETMAGPHDLEFFFWSGDADHDRSVNVNELGIIATNWQQPLSGYSNGDFNYDNVVDITDQGIMATHYGTRLDEPPSPGEISVTATSASTIALVWPKVEGCLGYRLQWSTDGTNFEFLKNVNSAGADSTTYEVTGLGDNTQYWFRVRAYGNNEDTAYSPKKAVHTVMPMPGQPGTSVTPDGKVQLSWADNSTNETGFVIEVDDGSQTWEVSVGPNTGPTASQVFDDLDTNADCYFRVKGLGIDPDQPYTAWKSRMKGHGAPFNLQATPISSSRVHLRWVDKGRNEDQYHIERRTAIGDWVGLGLIDENSNNFLMASLEPGTLYGFRVRNDGASGKSAYSNTAWATTPTSDPDPIPPPPTPDPLPGADPQPIGSSGGWTTYGSQVSVSGNTVSLGTPDLIETDVVSYGVQSASILIPADGPEQISFEYDLKSWDHDTYDPFYVSVRVSRSTCCTRRETPVPRPARTGGSGAGVASPTAS